MKKKFSPSWLSSKQPRKQRKFRANAPLHIKHKFMSSLLSKTLRKEHGTRAMPLRKNDEVLVMRGSFKKKKAKVTIVEPKRTRVALENIQRTKKDGTKVSVFFHPSSLQIQSLNMDDNRRIKKAKQMKEVKKIEAKPLPKTKEKQINAPDKK